MERRESVVIRVALKQRRRISQGADLDAVAATGAEVEFFAGGSVKLSKRPWITELEAFTETASRVSVKQSATIHGVTETVNASTFARVEKSAPTMT